MDQPDNVIQLFATRYRAPKPPKRDKHATIRTTVVASPSIEAEFESFANAKLAAGRSTRTIESYAESVAFFSAFLTRSGRSHTATDITGRDIDDFLVEYRLAGADPQHPRPMTGASVAVRYRALRVLFNYLSDDTKDEAILPRNPMARSEKPSVTHKPVPVLSDADLRMLLARTARDTTFEGRRDLAILALFLDTGLRLGEMAALGISHVDCRANQVYIPRGKTGSRLVTFNHATRKYVDRYLRLRAKHMDALQPDMWLGRKGRLEARGIAGLVKRRAAQAGVTLHVHQLRHTWAHNYLAHGGNEVDLMRNGGWADLTMISTVYGASMADARARTAARQHSLMDRLARP